MDLYEKKKTCAVSQPRSGGSSFCFGVYAGNQGKSVSALWGEILKQSADEEKINTQSADDEPLYAVGKDVSITMKEYEQVKSFYKLKSEDDGQAAKDADKEIKQYNALYAAASKRAIL